MSFISTTPGYVLQEALEEVDIEDVLVDKAELDKDTLVDLTILLQVAIEENEISEVIDLINNAIPTDAPSPVIREGFTQAPVVKKAAFALHYAARDGDVEKIKSLLADGYDVNSEDKKSARPLHYAALTGKIAAVKYLIQHQSDVHDTAYEGNTPLHFALKKHHYDVAKELVIQGKSNPYAVNAAGVSPIAYLLKDLKKQINNFKEGHSLEEIDKLLKTLLLFAEQGDGTYIVSEGIKEKKGIAFADETPLATELLLLAADVPHIYLQKVLLDGIHSIEPHNTSHQTYVAALNLLHRFPTGGIYSLALDKDKSMALVSEGHYPLFTTEFARDSLAAFIDIIPDTAEFTWQKEVYTSLYNIYVNAALFCEHANQEATYAQALALFNEGKTVLIPSGWSGHFVDVIISKAQQLYVVANSGDRYAGETKEEVSQNEPGDNAGLIFYRLEDVDKVNEKFIKDTLNNSSKMKLELEHPLKFGLLEALFTIENPDQEFGNCGWESHRDAIEGILLIELLNRDLPLEQAKDIAKEMYEIWDLFHGNYVIDKYMENNPGLPATALVDILLSLQPTKKANSAENNDVKNEAVSEKIECNEIKNHHHAQKIVDVLQSEKYKEDFKEFINTLDLNDADNKEFMQSLKENFHIDVDAMITHESEPQVTEPMGMDNVTAVAETVAPQPTEAHNISPHFNIAHQLMCMMPETILI